MSRKSPLEGMTKRERIALVISALLILSCILSLNFYDFSRQTSSDTKQIGYITEINNDIRHKNRANVFWETAANDQGVSAGDKIFTGQKSSAKVVLKNKSSFLLSESSLIEFKDYSKEKIASLAMGNFTINIKGKIKVLIDGNLAEIQGNDSQVKLTVDQSKKIKFEVVKGQTQISYKNKTYEVNNSQPIANLSEAHKVTAVEAATPLASNPLITHIEHPLSLYDIYQKGTNDIQYKTSDLTVVSQKVNLQIPGMNPIDSAFFEHADNLEFINAHQTHQGSSPYLHKVFVGRNYWRYSPDLKNWSQAMRFDVSTTLLANSAPSIKTEQSVPLINGLGKAKFIVSAPVDTSGYLVEYSENESFPRELSKIFWFYNDLITLQFSKPGNIYVRFRAVDKQLLLGEWSNVRQINIFKAPELSAPLWSNKEYESLVDEELTLSWKNQKNIKSYNLTILDAVKNTVFKKNVFSPNASWVPRQSGSYFAVVEGVDKYDRHSPPSSFKMVKVNSPVLQLTKTSSPKRMLTSTDLSSSLVLSPSRLNNIYIHSAASLASTYYSFQSSAQIDRNDIASSPGIVASLLVWLNNHGLEGIIQKNISTSQASSTASTDIIDADVRYRYRVTPRDFNFFKTFQTSLFIGYELYRNSDSQFFLSKYDFLKLGLVVDAPIFESWLLGGHLGYGIGSSMTKKEASVNIDYFFKRNWSMGAGYKINLIEATNSSEFPTFSVFREGYTNGALQVKYFF